MDVESLFAVYDFLDKKFLSIGFVSCQPILACTCHEGGRCPNYLDLVFTYQYEHSRCQMRTILYQQQDEIYCSERATRTNPEYIVADLRTGRVYQFVSQCPNARIWREKVVEIVESLYQASPNEMDFRETVA